MQTGLDEVFYSNLVPCLSIDVKQNIPDWKTYLMSKLVGATTLPVDFYLKVKQYCLSGVIPIKSPRNSK